MRIQTLRTAAVVRPLVTLAMLAALAQQLPPSRNTTRLDFDQGRLIVVWTGSAVDARALEAGMRERGYAAVTQSAQNGVVTTALAAKEKP